MEKMRNHVFSFYEKGGFILPIHTSLAYANDDNMKNLDNVILMQSKNSIMTLKDVANAMGIKSYDFNSKYTLPTSDELKDLDLTQSL
jgi:hypothetical protein